jgi:hypothetical protein
MDDLLVAPTKQFFKKHFEEDFEAQPLSLDELTIEKSRKEAAQLFYHICGITFHIPQLITMTND